MTEQPVSGTDTVTMEVARLLNVLSDEMTRASMQAVMGLKNADHFRKAYLLPALASGVVEMTLPGKPNSRSQRYRLTTQGKQWLASQANKL